LKKKVEKKIKILASNDKVDDIKAQKKIKRINKNVEKLQALLEITTSAANNKRKDGDNDSDKHIKNLLVFANDLKKVQDLLYNIDNSNNVLKILKQGDNENYVVDNANKIKNELQSKQNQFIEICKSFIHDPHKSL